MNTARKQRRSIKAPAKAGSLPYFQMLNRRQQCEGVSKLNASMSVNAIATLTGLLRVEVSRMIAEYRAGAKREPSG